MRDAEKESLLIGRLAFPAIGQRRPSPSEKERARF
jgi:hypothetical protein